MIRAAQKVYQKHPDLRLVLIGSGPKKSALQELASKLDMAERVTFTGELPFSDVIVYLKAADIFGFASVTETQGLVTMEALAAGLPVVAVDGSGTRDIVDNGEQGFLVRNDADELAASVNRLLESPEMMRKFHLRAIEKVKVFDIKICARQLLSVYEQAILDKSKSQYVEIEEYRKER